MIATRRLEFKHRVEICEFNIDILQQRNAKQKKIEREYRKLEEAQYNYDIADLELSLYEQMN